MTRKKRSSYITEEELNPLRIWKPMISQTLLDFARDIYTLHLKKGMSYRLYFHYLSRELPGYEAGYYRHLYQVHKKLVVEAGISRALLIQVDFNLLIFVARVSSKIFDMYASKDVIEYFALPHKGRKEKLEYLCASKIKKKCLKNLTDQNLESFDAAFAERVLRMS